MSYKQKPWLKYYHKNISEYSDMHEGSMTDLLRRAAKAFGDQTAFNFLPEKVVLS
ncbi:hypothetical protein [Caldalkalibacillus mannanilyticus]|uniref:hypothetical protein n=1 Tax=Caldalkalibacillus mannanilyticus TaxID=1418 RepID=UPI000ADB4843